MYRKILLAWPGPRLLPATGGAVHRDLLGDARLRAPKRDAARFATSLDHDKSIGRPVPKRDEVSRRVLGEVLVGLASYLWRLRGPGHVRCSFYLGCGGTLRAALRNSSLHQRFLVAMR